MSLEFLQLSLEFLQLSLEFLQLSLKILQIRCHSILPLLLLDNIFTSFYLTI